MLSFDLQLIYVSRRQRLKSVKLTDFSVLLLLYKNSSELTCTCSVVLELSEILIFRIPLGLDNSISG